MNRRDMIKALATVPLLGRIPAVQAAAGPQTVDELTLAIEGLFAEVVLRPRARDDEDGIVGFGMAAIKAEGVRIVTSTPFRFSEHGPAGGERALVRAAWRRVRRDVRGFEGEKLIWRVKPVLLKHRDFENDERLIRLNLRGHAITRPA